MALTVMIFPRGAVAFGALLSLLAFVDVIFV